MNLIKQRQLFAVFFVMVIGIFFATVGLQTNSSVETPQKISEQTEISKSKIGG
ncbi:MAG: hypothetical protein HQM14_06715 [SAR324 cluster bacterium]|nr:hypothetical protein [SAR324 cluster bacterium]